MKRERGEAKRTKGSTRLAIALLAGACAASIAVTAGATTSFRPFGSGSVLLSSCQHRPLKVSFEDRSTTRPALAVTVRGIDGSSTACAGANMRVQLSTGPDGASAVRTVTIPPLASTISVMFTGVDAALVTGARVSIAGREQ